jgi:hypothetical protein
MTAESAVRWCMSTPTDAYLKIRSAYAEVYRNGQMQERTALGNRSTSNAAFEPGSDIGTVDLRTYAAQVSGTMACNIEPIDTAHPLASMPTPLKAIKIYSASHFQARGSGRAD